ncbi:hypothetical protein SAMN06265337_0865 [Hymenobacter gelipurpurascens]|uniref:Uncharacterized protein n=1 Tax=Hymenobacter gelipurpurascens TaxID=89968 RepID=A0A212TBJ5_9BACT|nr:hypothetical protein [Hymenobacter gelipurpurascens]SNC63382.1 hypothetical protein SAMN06265337_0865 [Hymenobacter gelipurpurascens]
MMQVFDSPYLRILHDATYRVLEMQWQKATSVQFREGMLLGISQASRLGVHTWIGNLQAMQTLTPQDQEWIYEKWFPRFAALGIRRMAVIEPENPLNRIGIMQVMQHEASTVPLATAYFLSVEEARKWSCRRYTDILMA